MTTDNILAPVAALALPDSAALTASANRVLSFLGDFTIADNEDYGLAAEELQAVKARQKTLEGQRTSITVPLNAALKAVNALFGGPADVLVRAESVIKGKMLTWKNEQERIAAGARRAAEALAAAERKRLDDEAAAAWAAQQEALKAAEKAKAEGNELAAAQATAAAQRAQAEATTSAAISQMMVAPVTTVEAPKAKGISTSTRIDFEVTNLLQLVQHVAANPELIGLLQADSVRLRAYVKGVGMACKLPGVTVKEVISMAARAA